MSKSILFLFLMTAITPASMSQSIEDVKWLIGTWERKNIKTRTAYESWEWQGDKLKGIGVTIKEGDTVFVEKLQILMKEDTLYYVALPSQNKIPTFFKVTSLETNAFVCENPEHDFPQRIEYLLKGNRLVATISGNGRNALFEFVKISK